MKMPKLLLIIWCCFSSINLPAQTPKSVEDDLVKSFKRIGYWVNYKSDNRADDEKVISSGDSLGKANEVFSDKLKIYTQKYPFTLTSPLLSLKKQQVKVLTSSDGLFRIYSWDTWMGGTMHDFAAVMQYKANEKTESTFLASNENAYVPSYNKLYTFKQRNKSYYLTVYGTVYSNKDVGTGIRIYSIDDGKLNNHVNIIKTKSGLTNKLYYDYDFWSVVDIPFEKRPTITFDTATKTIIMPLVNDDGKVTKKFILYKFTGKYFEKVKS